ncbi:MAG: LPXTG cell wall anchor domain-containing protein [Ruminococcus sp.]|nr:LPXTG cell wall anchor domain-containing protein [Ruminococcus sp.]
MNDKITKYLNKIKAEKKKQKQAAAFITAMSLVVSGTVSWQLHRIGTAMNNGDRSEKADAGTEQLSAASPLCENPQIWEEGLPDITENDLRESVALVAESQIGYKENTDNFIPGEDGESLKYYTRYGDWYGNPYGEWNTMFTYFCMKYGGVDENDIPFGSGCWAWSVDLQKKELLITMDSGPPQRGDVILLDSDSDGKADRSGIVSELANEGDSQIIKVIEGNVSGTVAVQEYPIDDEHIIGYLALETEADNEAESVSSPAEQSEAETPPPTVVEFSGVSGSGIEVMASADVGVFPDGTVMTVSDIDREEALKAAKDSFDSEMLDAVAVDISFSDKDGNEIEPCADTAVQVQIILPDELKLHDGEFSLLHIADSGDVQKVENADVSETGAEFVAEEFSIYVVTSSGEVEKDKLIPDGNNGYINNSQSNPYVVPIGSVFTVAGYASQSGNYLYGWDNDGILDVRSSNDSNNADKNGYYRRERKFYAKKGGTTTISLDIGNKNYTHFYVKAVNPSEKEIYVVRWEEELHKNKLYTKDSDGTYVTNSQQNPYHLKVGDTITLAGYTSGDNYLYIASGSGIIDNVENSSVRENFEGINRNQKQYKASSPGLARIGLDIDGNGNYRYFWIEVLPPEVDYSNKGCDIYVKTALDDRNIDKVNEYLPLFGFPHSDDGYVYNSISTSNGTTKLYPYLLSVGQSADFYVNAPTSTMTYSGVKLPIVDTTTNDPFRVILGNVGQNTQAVTNNDLVITSTGNGAAKIDAKSSGLYRVTLKDGTNTLRDFYIYVIDTSFKDMSHSDIEISDGGKYTITQVEIDAVTGKKTTTLWEYDAVISGVNDCFIYDGSGQVIQNYNGANNDYKNIGESGQTQYEWTSEPSFTGHWSKTYNYSNVDHVVFDVKLELTPNSKKVLVEKSDENNNWVVDKNWTSESWTDDIITIDSVKYNLGEQDMIDAFNKCPNHTGMDFTARSIGALVQLNAEKELVGRPLQDNEFQFELIDQSDPDNTVWTSQNKENGTIEMFNHAYSTAGRYEYIAREITDDSDTSTIYDKSEYHIIINVTEKIVTGETVMIAEIEFPDGIPEFINYQTYELPATGGTGVIPYAVTGITIITGAAMLLIRSRRKEEN